MLIARQRVIIAGKDEVRVTGGRVDSGTSIEKPRHKPINVVSDIKKNKSGIPTLKCSAINFGANFLVVEVCTNELLPHDAM